MSVWAAAVAPDGRPYFYNKNTKETTWDQPDDFDGTLPASSRAAADNPADWSEAKADNGRTYYYNTVTRETKWELPEALKLQVQQRQQNGHSDFVAGGGAAAEGIVAGHGRDRPREFGRDGRDDRGHGLPQKPAFDGPREPRGGGGAAPPAAAAGGGGMPWENRAEERGGFRGPMPAKTEEPEYASPEAAEEAFFKCLKRHNVGPDTEWQDALRAVVRDREFRAIKDPKDRRAAFQKYCEHVRALDKEKQKERKEKIRDEFRRMLSTHDEIEHYTRWKTARPMLEREAVFKSAGDEDERRRIFDEYILELRKKHIESEAARRTTATKELDNMLKALIVDPDTRWADAEEKITNNERFVSDETFKALHKLDVFLAFESHMKALERVANDATQKEKRLKARRYRQARDAYKQMLKEKVETREIKPGTKWQDIFPLLKDDERLTNYLACPGSDPLELFWDIVEDKERELRSKRNDALDVLEDKRYEMTLETDMKTFVGVMRSHPKTASLEDHVLEMIYDKLMEKIKRRVEDERIGIERQQKIIVDNLRSVMKKTSPAIRSEDSYDQVAQILAGNREFEGANEELRRRAYEKFMTRLKEKEEQQERDRARRDRDRSRDRDYRNGPRRDERERECDRGVDRDRRHRTRTPEVDAYEADRRKAQADRERQYRKASFGLTPPPRDRYDDRRDDRRRSERPDLYDRERREREIERERLYMSRADPRDKGRTLDYGDEDQVGSRPPSIRKRRESDELEGRESKRLRHGISAEPSEPGVLKEEPPELQSGSEEGEIEEV